MSSDSIDDILLLYFFLRRRRKRERIHTKRIKHWTSHSVTKDNASTDVNVVSTKQNDPFTVPTVIKSSDKDMEIKTECELDFEETDINDIETKPSEDTENDEEIPEKPNRKLRSGVKRKLVERSPPETRRRSLRHRHK